MCAIKVGFLQDTREIHKLRAAIVQARSMKEAKKIPCALKNVSVPFDGSIVCFSGGD